MSRLKRHLNYDTFYVINYIKATRTRLLSEVRAALPGPDFQQVIDVLLDAAQAEVLLRRVHDSLGDGLPPVALLVRVQPRDLAQKYQVIQNREAKPLRFRHRAWRRALSYGRLANANVTRRAPAPVSLKSANAGSSPQ